MRRWPRSPVKSPLHCRVPPALMQGTKARFRLEMLLRVYDGKEIAYRGKTVVPSPHVKRLPPQGIQSVVQLGLRANWQQFTLLVIVNAFVGGMVGLERSIVPLLGHQVFGLASTTAVLSFIVSFGVVKALANLFAGRLGDRIGRKGVLVAGWLVGLPVPFLIIFAPSWGWVVFANILLGINQGLCWSTTVIMKIDLVGPASRGLAMGLNEAAGYCAVSASAIVAGYLAATYALRPQPFLLGIGFALAGLLLSLFFAVGGLSIAQIGLLAGIYPGVWGVAQLLTGALSDRLGRKGMIVGGMLLQGAAIGLLPLVHGFAWWVVAMVLLGLGTALVYSTLLAAISDVAHPDWRASAVGVYRLWRDSGYAIGALLAGVLADLFGVTWAIDVIAGVTFLSGVVVSVVMRETLPAQRKAPGAQLHDVS